MLIQNTFDRGAPSLLPRRVPQRIQHNDVPAPSHVAARPESVNLSFASAIRQSLLGLYRKPAAFVAYRLAERAHAENRLNQAEQGYLNAIALYASAYGSHHPYVAAIHYNLGSLYQGRNLFTKAEPQLLAAFAIEEKHRGQRDPKTIQTMQNLAALYHDWGKHREAVDWYGKVLQNQLHQPHRDYSALATTQADWAAFFHEQQAHGRARQLYTDAILNFRIDGKEPEAERVRHNLSQLPLNKPVSNLKSVCENPFTT